MKHIKTFENILQEPYLTIDMPKKISSQEGTEKMEKYHLDPLTTNEIEWIRKFIDRVDIGDCEIKENAFIIRDYKLRHIAVNKLEDSWFVILLINKSLPTSDSRIDEYYLADQFEEVQNYLRSL